MDDDDEQTDVTADGGTPAAEDMAPQAVAELSQELTLVARALFAQLLPSTAAHAVAGVGQTGQSASAVAHAARETTAQGGGETPGSSESVPAATPAPPAAVPVPGQDPLPVTPPAADAADAAGPRSGAVVPASIAVPVVAAPGLAPAPEQGAPEPAAVAVPGLAPTPDAGPLPAGRDGEPAAIPVPQATVPAPAPEAVPGTATDSDTDARSGTDRATLGQRRGVRSLALLEEISFLEE